MMSLNFLVIALAALIPMILGFIWYNPKVLGKAWQEACGLTDEKIKEANMPLVFGLSYVLSFFLAMAMNFMTIHQWGLFSMMQGVDGVMEAGTEANTFLTTAMEKYGNNFRTFKHGLFHGIIGGFMIALPIMGTNAMFERKNFKYIAINVGYWILCMGLMGGVICQFS